MRSAPQRGETDVCLVFMPYGQIESPSLAIGLLKSLLAEAKIGIAVHYENVQFAERIGLELYAAINHSPKELQLAEWTFAQSAFDDLLRNDEVYLDEIAKTALGHSFSKSFGDFREVIESVRLAAESWIDKVASSIIELRPRIVGCSSTFQQTCASLALLRRIRERAPEIITLMGGANCESPMGEAILDIAPWVDVAVSGEADGLIVDLCRALLEKGPQLEPADLEPGILVRPPEGAESGPPARAIQYDLDSLPTPDYQEYFTLLRDSPLASEVSPEIPIESSRGCWWGQKHHCTFCGLNGAGMIYRSKSPERIVAEFRELADKHSIDRFLVVDTIMEMSHIDTVLPRLRDQVRPLKLFYETKANLKKDQIGKLAKAGVALIQPGFEALDNRLLSLLNKGTTTQVNLRVLKWARELGVAVVWDFLTGAPGDADVWYAEVAEWLPLIEHLQPPQGVGTIHFDRFSPYHQRPTDFGLSLHPASGYRHIFPAGADLWNLAYCFEDESECILTRGMRGPGVVRLQNAVRRWKDRWSDSGFSTAPGLTLEKSGNGSFLVADHRSWSRTQRSILDDVEASILSLCDAGMKRSLLGGAFARRLRREVPECTLEAAVGRLCELGLLLTLGDLLLSLVLPPSCRPLPEYDLSRSHLPTPTRPHAGVPA